jgi:hypothetical protein
MSFYHLLRRVGAWKSVAAALRSSGVAVMYQYVSRKFDVTKIRREG